MTDTTDHMAEEYDLSRLASRPNPYAKALKTAKQPVTIRLSVEVIDYFKQMSLENNIPYQSLIDLYLKDCVKEHRQITWS